ncbi:MAG: phospho-N-acetylmuramoyl-pentapeptide-transferase [Candidatus Scalindua sp.]|nr:MAG: phospho-N-acetylmuramoyl-pentapeptide-transferase [Candidatus Scalindua sp.]
MLYSWVYYLHNHFSGLEIIKYISFRAGLAALTAFLISIFIGGKIIKMLKKYKVSEDTTKTDSARLRELHSDKKNVPTMGGVIMLISIIVSTLLWCDLFNIYIGIVLFATVWLGVVGFVDDYIKLKHKNVSGMSGRSKLIFQCGLGLILGLVLYFHFNNVEDGTKLIVPFFKELKPELGAFYVLMVMFFVVGMSNAVNITDGLDGLAIGCVVIAGLVITLVAYVVGRVDFSNYLQVPYIPGCGELSILCAALVGAGLGFMWFNCFPAQAFMGDTGSLPLGGILGIVAIIVKLELFVFFIYSIFIVEALSVVLQVGIYKVWKKRIFLCAPLHHHFQFKGWPETKITARFFIIAAIMALLSLITIKL